MNDEHVLSSADEAEVESLYRKMVTPWRCRIGLHAWQPWMEMGGLSFGVESLNDGRRSEMRAMALEMRFCPHCMKVQARAIPTTPDPDDDYGCTGCHEADDED